MILQIARTHHNIYYVVNYVIALYEYIYYTLVIILQYRLISIVINRNIYYTDQLYIYDMMHNLYIDLKMFGSALIQR